MIQKSRLVIRTKSGNIITRPVILPDGFKCRPGMSIAHITNFDKPVNNTEYFILHHSIYTIGEISWHHVTTNDLTPLSGIVWYLNQEDMPELNIISITKLPRLKAVFIRSII